MEWTFARLPTCHSGSARPQPSTTIQPFFAASFREHIARPASARKRSPYRRRHCSAVHSPIYIPYGSSFTAALSPLNSRASCGRNALRLKSGGLTTYFLLVQLLRG
ncbi:hypothetical protein MRX96_008990 [Rhipicephalus microplus]